jgi:CBS domain-containing protein
MLPAVTTVLPLDIVMLPPVKTVLPDMMLPPVMSTGIPVSKE